MPSTSRARQQVPIGAVRDSLLKQGIHLVTDRAAADTIVEIRVGALSIDETRKLLGIPSTPLPIPLAGQLTLPEVALFKKHQWQGVAKLAATAYDAKSGRSSTPADRGTLIAQDRLVSSL
jgi:hypothetical protein